LLLEALSASFDEGFRVELELFEGPLDLLLFLIRRNELEISQLALAEITSQYLAYLQVFQTLNISLAAEYLFHAATLVELKSALLLPRAEPESESDVETASEELVRQLRDYAQMHAVGERLADLQERALTRWLRQAPAHEAVVDLQLSVSCAGLCYALEELLRSIHRGAAHRVRLQEWSVPEKMQMLAVALERERRLSLTHWLAACAERGEMVALLLAALEIARSIRPIRLSQALPFADIELVLEES
jgi:segregation and condensation protein A